MQIRNIFFRNVIKYYNIIHINASENLINSQKSVNFTLHVKRRILKIYDCHIELFLLAMQYYDKFIFVC